MLQFLLVCHSRARGSRLKQSNAFLVCSIFLTTTLLDIKLNYFNIVTCNNNYNNCYLSTQRMLFNRKLSDTFEFYTHARSGLPLQKSKSQRNKGRRAKNE